MAKLNFHDLINFFWNHDGFSVTAADCGYARIYKIGDDENGDLYYMIVKANGDIVESIDFFARKMHHMKKKEYSKYVKAFSFDVCDIESVEHLVDVCKNTFEQLVVAEIRYLKQHLDKMNKLLID